MFVYLHSIVGPLDAGYTKSYYKMLDIMYDHGNDPTKELAVAMRKKGEAPVKSPSGMLDVLPPKNQAMHKFD